MYLGTKEPICETETCEELLTETIIKTNRLYSDGTLFGKESINDIDKYGNVIKYEEGKTIEYLVRLSKDDICYERKLSSVLGQCNY